MALPKALQKAPKVFHDIPIQPVNAALSRQNIEGSSTNRPYAVSPLNLSQIVSESKKVQQMLQQRMQLIAHENSYKFRYELKCLHRMNDQCLVLSRGEQRIQQLVTLTDHLRLLRMNNPNIADGESSTLIENMAHQYGEMAQQTMDEVTEALNNVLKEGREWFAEFGQEWKSKLVSLQGITQFAVEYRKTKEFTAKTAVTSTSEAARILIDLYSGICEAQTNQTQSKQVVDAGQKEEQEGNAKHTNIPEIIVVCNAFLAAGYIIIANLRKYKL